MSDIAISLDLSRAQSWLQDPAQTTIINRREIEPLLLEAHHLMDWYKKAAGCEISVLNTSGSSVEISDNKKTYPFCELCRSCFHDSSKAWKEDEYPCTKMHIDAQYMADRGGIYIYACKAGFSYWTSPLYAGLRRAGSMTAGQVLAVTREEAMERFYSRCGVPKEKTTELLCEVPQKNHEEVKAMAELLRVCAGKLSLHPRKFAQAIRKKSTGKKTVGKITVSEPGDGNRIIFNDKERMLLAALRRGDMNAVMRHQEELFGIIQAAGNADFDAIRFRFIELAASISRSAESIDHDENYDRCFRRVQESQAIEELRENLRLYLEYMGTRIFSFRGLRHACALRKAERFIWENYTRKISLNEIASASGLSAPYFSSIFKEERGINLSSYLNQLRVEKASGLLVETGLTLNEIAKCCGFEDQNWFSKIFKSRMGMSPGKFREQGNKTN